MDDPVLVRVPQRAQHLRHDPHRLVERELALAGEAVPEGFALDVGHDVVEHSRES